MAENVTVFPGLPAPAGHHEINPELIAKLEEFLEDAKSGQLIDLAYAAVRQHELVKVSWVGSGSRGLLGYAISRLQHEFFAACIEDD